MITGIRSGQIGCWWWIVSESHPGFCTLFIIDVWLLWGSWLIAPSWPEFMLGRLLRWLREMPPILVKGARPTKSHPLIHRGSPRNRQTSRKGKNGLRPQDGFFSFFLLFLSRLGAWALFFYPIFVHKVLKRAKSHIFCWGFTWRWVHHIFLYD